MDSLLNSGCNVIPYRVAQAPVAAAMPRFASCCRHFKQPHAACDMWLMVPAQAQHGLEHSCVEQGRLQMVKLDILKSLWLGHGATSHPFERHSRDVPNRIACRKAPALTGHLGKHATSA